MNKVATAKLGKQVFGGKLYGNVLVVRKGTFRKRGIGWGVRGVRGGGGGGPGRMRGEKAASRWVAVTRAPPTRLMSSPGIQKMWRDSSSPNQP